MCVSHMKVMIRCSVSNSCKVLYDHTHWHVVFPLQSICCGSLSPQPHVHKKGLGTCVSHTKVRISQFSHNNNIAATIITISQQLDSRPRRLSLFDKDANGNNNQCFDKRSKLHSFIFPDISNNSSMLSLFKWNIYKMINAFMNIKPILQQPILWTTSPYSTMLTKWLWIPNVWRIGSVSMYLTMHLASEATQIMMMQHSKLFQLITTLSIKSLLFKGL